MGALVTGWHPFREADIAPPIEGRLHRLRLSVARWIRRQQVVSDSSAAAHHGLCITGDACLVLEGARVTPDDRGLHKDV